jgi:hypothetical protein
MLLGRAARCHGAMDGDWIVAAMRMLLTDAELTPGRSMAIPAQMTGAVLKTWDATSLARILTPPEQNRNISEAGSGCPDLDPRKPMSTEIHVLFQGTLPTKAALTRAMKELGFPLTISPPTDSLEKQSGFMPMRFRREETGVEFDVFTGRTDIEDLAGDRADDIDPRFDRSANFRWGGDENEMICGVCAAAALAMLVGGAVLDDDAEVLSVDEAIAWAKKHLHDATPPAKRGGTRPADIKRYLKPLLKERNDLALIGRRLVIKPVRHILRGALFGQTGSKYCFRIWRYIQGLYERGADVAVGDGDFDFGPSWDVWQPHFEPALMDVLAEDVFERVGQVTTVEELADEVAGSRRFSTAEFVTRLLLAGERDRAEAYVQQQVEQLESENPPQVWRIKDLRWHLGVDIEALCAASHAREARAAKTLQIEHIWEPSPFPVELPAAERRAKSAEPLFIPRPWIARPAWLLQELPDQVGETRYAKGFFIRKGRPVLIASLSAEQAADRHHNSEPYALATRLSEGLALLLARDGEDRDDPARRPEYVSLGGFFLRLQGSAVVAAATFYQADDDEKMLELSSIDILDNRSQEWTWSWSLRRRESTESIRDYRGDETVVNANPITDADIALLTCPKPAFGDFEAAVAMVITALRSRGYGEIS